MSVVMRSIICSSFVRSSKPGNRCLRCSCSNSCIFSLIPAIVSSISSTTSTQTGGKCVSTEDRSWSTLSINPAFSDVSPPTFEVLCTREYEFLYCRNNSVLERVVMVAKMACVKRVEGVEAVACRINSRSFLVPATLPVELANFYSVTAA